MTQDGLPDEADSDDDEMDVDFKQAESSKSEFCLPFVLKPALS